MIDHVNSKFVRSTKRGAFDDDVPLNDFLLTFKAVKFDYNSFIPVDPRLIEIDIIHANYGDRTLLEYEICSEEQLSRFDLSEKYTKDLKSNNFECIKP